MANLIWFRNAFKPLVRWPLAKSMFMIGLSFLATGPGMALERGICPKVAPAASIEVLSVRPIPNNQWVIRYSASAGSGSRAVPKEAVVNRNNKLSPSIGVITWAECDITKPKPQTIRGPKTQLEQFADLIRAAGPTDTEFRPLTSKPSTWGEKAAAAAKTQTDENRVAAAPSEQEKTGSAAQLSSGTANIVVISVQGFPAGSPFEKAGLLSRDVIIGINDITFKNENDANSLIESLDANNTYLFNVVRKGKYLNLTYRP